MGGYFKCASCDDGYYLTSNFTCELNVCECSNGTATGKSCPKNGDTFCSLCLDGYVLNNSTNKCDRCDSSITSVKVLNNPEETDRYYSSYKTAPGEGRVRS